MVKLLLLIVWIFFGWDWLLFWSLFCLFKVWEKVCSFLILVLKVVNDWNCLIIKLSVVNINIKVFIVLEIFFIFNFFENILVVKVIGGIM